MATLNQFKQVAKGDNPSQLWYNDTCGELLYHLALQRMGLSDAEFLSDSLASTSGVSSANSSYFFGDGSQVYLAHGFDEFASYDTTNKWTTVTNTHSNVSVSGGALVLTGTDAAASGANDASVRTKTGASGFNPKTMAGDCYAEFVTSTVSYDDGSFQHSASATIKIGNTTIKTQSGTQNGGTGPVVLSQLGGTWKCFFSLSGQTVRVFKDGTEITGSPFNISAESDWTVYFQVTSGNSTTHSGASWSIDYFRYIIAGGATLTFQTGNNSISASKTFASFYLSYTLNNCAFSNVYLSIDGGSTFTTADNTKALFQITSTTGTNAVLKLQFTPPSSFTVSGSYTPFPSIDYWYAWVLA